MPSDGRKGSHLETFATSRGALYILMSLGGSDRLSRRVFRLLLSLIAISSVVCGLSLLRAERARAFQFAATNDTVHTNDPASPQGTVFTFSNNAPITIPASGTGPGNASPYPSTINVAGVNSALLSKVTVELSLLTHSFANDIDIVLVGPGGERSILMSDAGGGSPGPSNVSITFDQSAVNPISEIFIPATGTVRPANYGSGDDIFNPGSGTLPANEPADLNVFNGTDPNGAWHLYVVDDAGGDSGSISLGWTLKVFTSVITVDNTSDDNDHECAIDCSLREAIDTAAPGDTIVFSSLFNSAQTISLTAGQIVISKSLTITGPGADRLTLSGVSNGANRFFDINGGLTFQLSGLTLQGANAPAAFGAGLINNGTTNISACTIRGNLGLLGGGISNQAGTMTITHSTITGNTTVNSDGGGIINFATLTIINSTISQNFANGFGGGIRNGGTLVLRNSTIADNGAAGSGEGGGISNVGTVTMKNTIVAQNTGQTVDDIAGTITSEGYNLIGNSFGATITGTTTGNQLDVNPRLGMLADNGGPTQTYSLLNGSPAIDRGSNASGGLTDQTGQPRTTNLVPSNAEGGDETDIGAFEVQTMPACAAPATPIAFGQTRNGTIAPGDCFLPTGAQQYDAYTFSGTAGQHIAIEMHSSFDIFDTFLDLYSGTFPGGMLIASDNDGGSGFGGSRIPSTSGFLELPTTGTYTIVARQFLPDTFGSYALTLSQEGDTTAPTATGSALDVTTGGASSHTATVVYADDVAINVSTIGTSDIRITGPNGFNQTPSSVSFSPTGDGTPRSADYNFTPPGGTWDAADNGTYNIVMQANQVADTSGNFVAAGTVGSFVVAAGDVTASGDPIVGVAATLGNAISTASTVGTTEGQNNYPAAEGPTNVIDDISSSKYLNFAETGVGFITTPSTATVITGVHFDTANDSPERDPLTISIEGTNSPNATTTLNSSWTTIYNGASGLSTDPGRESAGSVIAFSNTNSYTSYRVLVQSVRDAPAANSMQFAEIRLIGTTFVPPTPQTFVVNSLADPGDGTCNGANCTLREAINAANASSNTADTINFQAGLTGTIMLSSGQLGITDSVTINGPGTNVITVSGNNASRVFAINTGISVGIGGVTITGGNVNESGGGIYSAGTLTVTHAAVLNNHATSNGSNGGGIISFGALTISDSVISGNTAANAAGIESNSSTLNLIRSTVSNNVADFQGGGVRFFDAGGSITNSTISGNTANSPQSAGGGVYVESAVNSTVQVTNSTIANNITGTAGTGGGIRTVSFAPGNVTTQLKNSIIANNTLPNLASQSVGGSAVVTSQGFNLTSDDGGGFLAGIGDQINTDPLLGPLTNNGGPTETHALLNGSPAIDKGSNAGSGVSTDQLGLMRTVNVAPNPASGGDETDIGAFEAQTMPPCTATATPIAIGQSLGANLQRGDCFYQALPFQYDAFTFTGTAGQQIAVSQNSNDFDTFVELYTGSFPGGTRIAADNDGGGGTNSRIPAGSGFFTLPASGTYTILATNNIADTYGAHTVTLTLGETIAPTAAGSAIDVTTAGGTSHTAFVTYTDNIAVSVATLGVDDVRITGPNGFNGVPTSVVAPPFDGTPRTGNYEFAAPGGSWDAGDSGTYNIVMQPNQVADTSGNFVAAGSVGSFTVNIPVATPTPTPTATPTPSVTPTPSPTPVVLVTVSGRVLTPDGRGINGATVIMFDSSNNQHRVRTNSFGSYRIDAVAAGQTYLLVASAKRYIFQNQNIQPMGDLANIDFTGIE